MSSTVSSFFSRDSLLRCQVRSNRTHKQGTRPPLAKIPCTQTGSLLDIILEEDTTPTPTPSPPPTAAAIAPMLTTRTQRRRQAITAQDLKATTTTTELVTPHFNVSLTNVSFNFPLPPVPTPTSLWKSSSSSSSSSSPPSICSSPSSSPDSQSAGLPQTPTTSDDELSYYHPRRSNLKRSAAIKPLVISKPQRSSTLPTIDRSSSDIEEEYDADSDSEWYTREFSRVLTLHSDLPHTSSYPAAHRDSIAIAPTTPFECDSPISPPDQQRKRRGIRYSILDAPPPPPPPPPTSSIPPIPSKFSSQKCAKTLSITAPRRPPPRMSIPDDACSVFSLSMYMDDIVVGNGDDDDDGPGPSPLSVYSQESLVLGDFERQQEVGLGLGLGLGSGRGREQEEQEEEGAVEFPAGFEVQVDDGPMMLPLSLPGSPLDLEADIAHGLEVLRTTTKEDDESPRSGEGEADALGVGFVLEEDTIADDREEVQGNKATVVPQPFRTRALPSLPVVVPALPLPTPPPPPSSITAPTRRGRSPTPSAVSSFSFPPSPSPESSALEEAPSERSNDDFDERRHGLKSKWSSSTLASVSEEHASPGSKFLGASKLKMYFQGQHKRHNSTASSPLSPKFTAKFPLSPLPSPGKGGKGKGKKEKGGEKGEKRECDVTVIGYNQQQQQQPPPLGRRSHDSYYYNPASPIPSPRKSFGEKRSPRRSYDLPMAPSGPRARRQGSSSGGVGGVKRSASQCSASGTSDCGSEVSYASSSASSSGMGLRRKPIPVEMFLRGGV